MNNAIPFWEKSLESLDRGEWEALCDGCGRCCLHKLEDEETGELFPTNVACKLLDRRTGQCTDYTNRKKLVHDCVQLDQHKLDELEWLPATCAYRLRWEGSRCRNGIIRSPEAARRSMRRGNRPAAGRSARSMPASWNGILSTSRSEPLSLPGWPGRSNFVSILGPSAAVTPRRGARAAGADRPEADELPDRPAMGTRASPWVESQLGTFQPGGAVSSGRDHPRSRAATFAFWDEGLPRIAGNCRGYAPVRRPGRSVSARIERFLRSEARAPAEPGDDGHGDGPESRSAQFRSAMPGAGGGSCSACGAIRYNWRIILAPPTSSAGWLRMKWRTAGT